MGDKSHFLPGNCIPVKFSHGFDLGHSYLSPYPIISSLQAGSKSSLTVYNYDSVYVFTGIQYTKIYSNQSERISRIVFVSSLHLYICQFGGYVLRVYSESFMEISSYYNDTSISGLLSNELTPEVPSLVTCGQGNITLWLFRVISGKIFPKVVHKHLFLQTQTPQLIYLDISIAKQQRCYAAIDGSLLIFLLETGTLICTVSDIYCSPISCILSIPGKNICIVGSETGVLKVLDENFQLIYSFLGHTSTITSTALLPKCNLILTASKDSTLRMWNIDTGDVLHVLDLGTPTYRIFQVFENYIYLQSEFGITELNMQSICSLYRSLPSPITCLCHLFSSTIFLCMNSGMLAIINTFICEIVNVLCIDEHLGCVHQVIMSQENGLLLVLTDVGNILLGKMDTFPISLIKILKGKYSSMAHYVHSEKLQLSEYEGNNSQSFPQINYDIILSSFVLFVGSDCGKLSRMNLFSGNEGYSIPAHHGKISCIISQSTISKILTFDLHRNVKIWQVYSHIYECLLQVDTFSLISVPSIIISTKKRLCVAINSPEHSFYIISMYNTQSLKKYSHSYAHDHEDNINDLANCSRSGIFISIGMDRTFRVWNKCNALIVVLSMSFIPTCVCLASENGDILISMGKQLFVVIASSYIPKSVSQDCIIEKAMECEVLNNNLLIGPLDRLTTVSLQVFLREKFIFRTKNLYESLSPICEVKSIKDSFVHNGEVGIQRCQIVEVEKSGIVPFNQTEVDLFQINEESLSKYGYNSSPYIMNISLDDGIDTEKSIKEIEFSKPSSKTFSSSHFFNTTDSKLCKSYYIPNSNLVSDKTKINDLNTCSMDILRETLDIGAGNCKELQNNLVNIVGPNLNVVKNHKYLNFSEESTKPCPTISPLSVKKVMPTANSQSSAPKVVKKIINSSSMLYANASTKQSGNTSPKITSNASTNMSGNATTELSGHPSTKAGNDSPIENLRLIDSCPINSVPNSIVPKVLSVLDQYSQDEWFRELFPRHQTTPFKGDISGYNCIQVIISACTNIFSCKVIICTLRAILQIVKQLSFSIVEKQKCGRLVIQMLFNSQLFDMPLPQEENYILTMLTILNELCSQDDYMYISLLLVEYILGEFETRSYITKVLQGYGFFDSFHYLSKEFDSWDMNHMHVSRKRFLFEQTIKWLKNISTGNYYLKPFENCPTSSSSKSLHECSCIEALNSFVVFKREENFGMTKEVVSEDHVPTPIHDDKYSDHRTVFSLPKISYSEKVIRIGETFVSKCHGERESTLLNYQMLPRLNLFRKNLSRNLFLQIPVHDQKISLPLDCDPNGQTLTIKRKYFVSSESQLL